LEEVTRGLPKHSLAQSRHYSESMRARMPTGSYSEGSRQRAAVKISRCGYTSVSASCEVTGRRRRTEVRCNSFGRSSRSITPTSGRYCRQSIFHGCPLQVRASRNSQAYYSCLRPIPPGFRGSTITHVENDPSVRPSGSRRRFRHWRDHSVYLSLTIQTSWNSISNPS
jgi:hypothetical protein